MGDANLIINQIIYGPYIIATNNYIKTIISPGDSLVISIKLVSSIVGSFMTGMIINNDTIQGPIGLNVTYIVKSPVNDFTYIDTTHNELLRTLSNNAELGNINDQIDWVTINSRVAPPKM